MGSQRVFRVFVPAFLFLLPNFLGATEKDALAIDATLLARHLPFGTVLNPIVSADHAQIVGYTRCGDSAIWTGHYLAAEAFRFRATLDPQALANARAALAGLNLLVDITGMDLLSRCVVPTDSPFAAGIISEESPNGIYKATLDGRTWYLVGNTSRDQYCGVFFGLGAAYDLIPDAAFQQNVASLATRLLNRLLKYSWNVVMPDGSVSTTFALRPDQELTFLQIGRHVNPQQFASEYSRQAGSLAPFVPVPLGVDAADDHSSYFKFNLAFINLYNLIRLEDNASNRTWYERGFSLVRGATDNHLNPHFNMIDRALHGPNAARDQETLADLTAWLERPRYDGYVDLHGKVQACGSEACHPIPVAERPPSDFLWQLDPFQLSGGGLGIIETAGIDYLLPYWMARYFGLIPDPSALAHVHASGVLHRVGRI